MKSLFRWCLKISCTQILCVVVLGAIVASLPALRGSGRSLDTMGNFSRFLGKFFPPDLSITPQILRALGETAQIAILATLFAVILSLPLAFAGSRTISPRWLVWSMRLVMNTARTIPSLIWALLAVAIFGANSLAGVLALSFYSLGYLGKFYSDALESCDLEVSRGLRAIGADSIQAFQYGLWPSAQPLIWSSTLWMLEYNIRSAAIIGYVGAGGIGMQLFTYQEYGQWDRFCTVLLFILAMVTLLDFAGEWMRAKFTGKHFKPLTQT